MKKTSIISGGSSGLGLEMAELLMKAGKNVLILGRDTNRVGNALARLNNPSFQASWIRQRSLRKLLMPYWLRTGLLLRILQ